MQAEKSSSDSNHRSGSNWRCRAFFSRMYTVKLAYGPLCECVLYMYVCVTLASVLACGLAGNWTSVALRMVFSWRISCCDWLWPNGWENKTYKITTSPTSFTLHQLLRLEPEKWNQEEKISYVQIFFSPSIQSIASEHWPEWPNIEQSTGGVYGPLCSFAFSKVEQVVFSAVPCVHRGTGRRSLPQTRHPPCWRFSGAPSPPQNTLEEGTWNTHTEWINVIQCNKSSYVFLQSGLLDFLIISYHTSDRN